MICVISSNTNPSNCPTCCFSVEGDDVMDALEDMTHRRTVPQVGNQPASGVLYCVFKQLSPASYIRPNNESCCVHRCLSTGSSLVVAMVRYGESSSLIAQQHESLCVEPQQASLLENYWQAALALAGLTYNIRLHDVMLPMCCRHHGCI